MAKNQPEESWEQSPLPGELDEDDLQSAEQMRERGQQTQTKTQQAGSQKNQKPGQSGSQDKWGNQPSR